MGGGADWMVTSETNFLSLLIKMCVSFFEENYLEIVSRQSDSIFLHLIDYTAHSWRWQQNITRKKMLFTQNRHVTKTHFSPNHTHTHTLLNTVTISPQALATTLFGLCCDYWKRFVMIPSWPIFQAPVRPERV